MLVCVCVWLSLYGLMVAIINGQMTRTTFNAENEENTNILFQSGQEQLRQTNTHEHRH